MPWLIDHISKRDSERFDSFFLEVGKSLYLANNYEAKCRDLLLFVRLANELRNATVIDAAIEVCNAMKNNMLAITLNELGTSPIAARAINELKAAKDGRNHIAHEGALLGPLSAVSVATLDARESQLRNAVSALAIGDNLISGWLYEIEEKQPPPSGISHDYPEWVNEWVFGSGEPETEDRRLRDAQSLAPSFVVEGCEDRKPKAE